MEENAHGFLHRSPSAPCPAAVRTAKGIRIEDMGGKRYMDFHGNNVHHVGCGHLRSRAV